MSPCTHRSTCKDCMLFACEAALLAIERCKQVREEALKLNCYLCRKEKE